MGDITHSRCFASQSVNESAQLVTLAHETPNAHLFIWSRRKLLPPPTKFSHKTRSAP